MSEHTAKEAAEKLIKVLNVHQIKEQIKLGEAIAYANEYVNRNDRSNIEIPTFPFYSAIIVALVKLARDILNVDILKDEHINIRRKEFKTDIDKCHTEYNKSVERDINSKTQDDMENMLDQCEDIYRNYSTFYKNKENKSPRKGRRVTWKHPVNNRGNHNGGKRTMRAKRRRQI